MKRKSIIIFLMIITLLLTACAKPTGGVQPTATQGIPAGTNQAGATLVPGVESTPSSVGGTTEPNTTGGTVIKTTPAPTQKIQQAGDIVSLTKVAYGYTAMTVDIARLQAKFPGILTVSSIGTSVFGRNIPLLILGNPANTRKILIQGSSHGREYATTQLIMKQIETYCETLNTTKYADNTYKSIIDKCAIYFVPMSNPDGVELSINGIESVPQAYVATVKEIYNSSAAKGLLGSNYTRWKANGLGIDINQNFGTATVTLASNYNRPMSQNYAGQAPFCTPESVAIKQLCESNDFLSVTSYHSSGEIIYWHFGQTGTVESVSYEYACELKALTGYSLVSKGPNITFCTSVGLKDWFINQYNRPGFTIEIGTGDAPISPSQFESVWNKNALVPIHLAWKAGNTAVIPNASQAPEITPDYEHGIFD